MNNKTNFSKLIYSIVMSLILMLLFIFVLPVAIALVIALVLFVILANIIFRLFPSSHVSFMSFVYKNQKNQHEYSIREDNEMKDVTNSVKTIKED